jgi:hypothetical protein
MSYEMRSDEMIRNLTKLQVAAGLGELSPLKAENVSSKPVDS